LPEEFRGGYFAAVLQHDHRVMMAPCGSISPDVDSDIGVNCLRVLARAVRREATDRHAEHETDLALMPSSAQARAARLESGTTQPALSRTFLIAVPIVTLLTCCLVAIVVSPVLVLPVIVLAVLMTIVVFATHLRSTGQLAEGNFVDIVKQVFGQLPAILKPTTPDDNDPPPEIEPGQDEHDRE
jgi:hypothetical protein